MTDGNSAYAGEFEGLAPYCCSRSAFPAPTRVGVETHPAFAGHSYAWTRKGKEDWLLEIRIGSRADDTGRVAGRD